MLQNAEQKTDLRGLYSTGDNGWKSLDYVAGWFIKAAGYQSRVPCHFAFVATNSICQGEQVPILWPSLFSVGLDITFACTSFKWTNLASHNAGVIVVVVGMGPRSTSDKLFWEVERSGVINKRIVRNIGPYLVPGPNTVVKATTTIPSSRTGMVRGNMPSDGGQLILSAAEVADIKASAPEAHAFIRSFVGSRDFINLGQRYCVWITDSQSEKALTLKPLRDRIEKVRAIRLAGGQQARDNAASPYRFVFAPHRDVPSIIIPRHFSERREYVTPGFVDGRQKVIADSALAIYNADLTDFSILASRVHLVWIATVCGKIKTDYRYSNTLGWNTFPVPSLTEQNKADLTRCAEGILLAREAHFPATIADLYDPETMPANLRAAHESNDEALERIYIGRRFRNDTERLEMLFAMYAKATATQVRQTERKPSGTRNGEKAKAEPGAIARSVKSSQGRSRAQ